MSEIPKEATYGSIETTRGTKLHTTKPPREKAFLVGAELTGGRSAWSAEDSLAELALLVDTADIDVVGQIHQRLKHTFAQYYIGPGKVAEIAALKESLEFDLVVFDEELTPGQTRNLEETLDVRVVDRTTIILDIFARHARTREGRIQVELAQYKYLLPRLRRQWTHLERQAGGGGGSAGGVVGLRGPGETQLEVDRRLVNKRITVLEQHIKEIHTQREVYRERRRDTGIQVVAIVGYTNAGKSSLLRRLTGAEVLVEDKLFATLDTTTRKVALPSHQPLLLTDTVGFVRKLPHRLVEAFKATLEEAVQADFLVHLLDASAPEVLEFHQTTIDVLKELGAGGRPAIIVFNKVDKVADPAVLQRLRSHFPDALFISAHTGEGIPALLEKMTELASPGNVTRELRIPAAESGVLARLHREAQVLRVAYDGSDAVATVTLSQRLAEECARFIEPPPKARSGAKARKVLSRHKA